MRGSGATSAATPRNGTRPRRWKIHLTLESKKLGFSPKEIKALTQKILTLVDDELAPRSVCELHIMLVNDARMREINFQFRKKDKATDVLSFPQLLPQEVSGAQALNDLHNPYLGDLVISTETTIKQAKRFQVTRRAELIRLLTHGVLHLCGYDHEKVPPREAQRMRRREKEIRLKITGPSPRRRR